MPVLMLPGRIRRRWIFNANSVARRRGEAFNHSRVRKPITPSGSSPCHFWKRLTASTSSGEYTLSATETGTAAAECPVLSTVGKTSVTDVAAGLTTGDAGTDLSADSSTDRSSLAAALGPSLAIVSSVGCGDFDSAGVGVIIPLRLRISRSAGISSLTCPGRRLDALATCGHGRLSANMIFNAACILE